MLLNAGSCFFLGGIRYKEQTFNATANKASASLLFLAAIALTIPSAGLHLYGGQILSHTEIDSVSYTTAIILALVYALSPPLASLSLPLCVSLSLSSCLIRLGRKIDYFERISFVCLKICLHACAQADASGQFLLVCEHVSLHVSQYRQQNTDLLTQACRPLKLAAIMNSMHMPSSLDVRLLALWHQPCSLDACTPSLPPLS